MNRDNYPSRKGKPSVETYILDKLIMNKLNAILSNWKTTLLGIAAIITTLADGVTAADIPILITGIVALFAKDADKTNASHPSATKSTK